MDVYFATEFATIEIGSQMAKRISIGCVAEDGREFYAELTGAWVSEDCREYREFDEDTAPRFFQRGEYHLADEEKLATKLRAWIESLTTAVYHKSYKTEVIEMVILRSDYKRLDWTFVENLFQRYGGLPRNLHRKCGDVYWYQNTQDRQKYHAALTQYWNDHQDQEDHALIKAKSFLFASESPGGNWSEDN